VIPEIDIWRAAQLMLKRYGNRAEAKSTARAHGYGDWTAAACVKGVIRTADRTDPRSTSSCGSDIARGGYIHCSATRA